LNQVVGSSNLSGRANFRKGPFRTHGLHLLRCEGIGPEFDAALALIELAGLTTE